MKNYALILSKGLYILALVVPATFLSLIVYSATIREPHITLTQVGPYEGKKLSEKELLKVIQNHAEWLRVYDGRYNTLEAQKDKRKAVLTRTNLNEACANTDDIDKQRRGQPSSQDDLSKVIVPNRINLSKVDLSKAQIGYANLEKASLCNANFSGTNLSGTNLSGAQLWGASLARAQLISTNLKRIHADSADLSDADLGDANLTNAWLEGANMTRADLGDANLGGAYLRKANLSDANLAEVNLEGADLTEANVSGTRFEPKTLPDVIDIAYAANLEAMRYERSPQALIKLRKTFKDAGFDGQERKITYAIKHSETMKTLHVRHWRELGIDTVEGMFKYIFFDLTTMWGMAPRRALWILLALIPVFAGFYFFSLKWPGKNGIWCKWLDDRMRTDIGTKEAVRLEVAWCQALKLGLYFSILSAFNIGWRELNVGNWIQRLQPKEYTLRATGWARTVSGVQAIISVYLLALWVLTYFSRPFE